MDYVEQNASDGAIQNTRSSFRIGSEKNLLTARLVDEPSSSNG